MTRSTRSTMPAGHLSSRTRCELVSLEIDITVIFAPGGLANWLAWGVLIGAFLFVLHLYTKGDK